MQFLLDNLAVLMFLGTFTLSILTFQASVSTSSSQIQAEIIKQQDMVSFARVLDYDFKKIGHKNSAPNLKTGFLDSTQIMFYGDLNNNGAIDSLHYYLSDTTALASTANPSDCILYRRFNNGVIEKVLSGVVTLKFSYLDSATVAISYGSLSTPSQINKVRGVQIEINLESPYPIDGEYPGIAWQNAYMPVGLKN